MTHRASPPGTGSLGRAVDEFADPAKPWEMVVQCGGPCPTHRRLVADLVPQALGASLVRAQSSKGREGGVQSSVPGTTKPSLWTPADMGIGRPL
jgi:hypothetical protein